MADLRSPYFLIAALSSILFFVPTPLSNNNPWMDHLWDLGHVVVFTCWSTLAIYHLQRYFVHYYNIVLVVLAGTILLGGAIELIQMNLARESSWHDLALDVCGCFIASNVRKSQIKPCRLTFRLTLRILFITSVLFALYPLASLSSDHFIASRQFPVLIDNSTPFELERLSGKAGRSIVLPSSPDAAPTIEITFGIEQYSVLILNRIPGDWSGYQFLSLNLYLTGQTPLALELSLADNLHLKKEGDFSDLFNVVLVLQPGANTIDIPLADVRLAPKEREMDMRKITSLSLYSTKLAKPRSIYLNEIKLTHPR